MEPIMNEIVGDLELKVYYESPNYRVRVEFVKDNTKYLEESFVALYEPKFGIDVDDMQRALDTAEKLAVELESNAS